VVKNIVGVISYKKRIEIEDMNKIVKRGGETAGGRGRGRSKETKIRY